MFIRLSNNHKWYVIQQFIGNKLKKKRNLMPEKIVKVGQIKRGI